TYSNHCNLHSMLYLQIISWYSIFKAFAKNQIHHACPPYKTSAFARAPKLRRRSLAGGKAQNYEKPKNIFKFRAFAFYPRQNASRVITIKILPPWKKYLETD
ncbi:MAG: hypothetical protein V3S16_10315, partial [Candidatus Desulfatibia sp.]|uniref:hypothetical protein n=1 Tax=Candidatus Desulfatibia sp. TaxID=3101189 RepID=UPI002F325033